MNSPSSVPTTIPHQPEPFFDRSAEHPRCKRSPESCVEKLLQNAEARFHAVSLKCRAEVQKAPGRSVLLAAAGGYFFRRLPVASLLATGLKLAGAFAPPTLIAHGVCRVAEYCRLKDRERKSLALADDSVAHRVPVTDV